VKIQELIFEILVMAHRLYITFFPVHLYRSDPRITVADVGSLENPSDDWGIDENSFQNLHRRYKYTIDVFASDISHRLPKYFALPGAAKSFSTDAFYHSWEGEILWLSPPVALVIRTVRKLRKLRSGKGSLIVPAWKTAPF